MGRLWGTRSSSITSPVFSVRQLAMESSFATPLILTMGSKPGWGPCGYWRISSPNNRRRSDDAQDVGQLVLTASSATVPTLKARRAQTIVLVDLSRSYRHR